MKRANFFILMGVLSAIASCSQAPTAGTQGYGGAAVDEAPSEIDQIASANVHRDANGQVTSVDGLKVNANLVPDIQAEKSQDQAEVASQENLKNSLISDDKLFEYDEPSNTVAEFSEPKMVSASYLALSDVSNLCDDSGTFSENEPRISTVVNHVKECGDYRMYFCIRLSDKYISSDVLSSTREKKYAFIETPSLSVNLPCSDSIFKDISINIEDGKASTSRSSVSLAFTARPLVSKMFVTNSSDCQVGGVWENFNAKKFAWILSPDKEKITTEVYVKFKDLLFGYESECIKDAIAITASTAIDDNTDKGASGNTGADINTGADNSTATTAQDPGPDVDTTPPTALSLSIEGGAAYTTSLVVNLSLAATDASQMYLTNTAGCGAGGTWENYASSKTSWTLGQSNASATVYVKFKDAAGNESSCVSDSIIHDNTAPSLTSVTISSGASYTTSSSVSLSLAATDASQMYLTNTAGCGSGGSWESYATSKAWTLGQSNASATVYGKFKDAAGNESSCVNDSIIHDNTVPSFTTFTISSGASYTTSSSVSLSFAASADASEMYLTNTAGCASGGSWQAYATGNSPWTLGQTNGTATVYGKVKDNAGNTSTCSSDTIIHDSVVPTTPGSIMASSGSTSQVVLSWSASTDSGSGIAAYEVALGTTTGGTEVKDWTNVGNVTSATVTGLSLSNSSTYYASVRAVDSAGNVSSVTTGTVDTTLLVHYDFNSQNCLSSTGSNNCTANNITYVSDGSGGYAASLSGTSSLVLPNSLIKSYSIYTLSLRFKATSSQYGGLWGYQDSPVGGGAGSMVPILAIRSDGKLSVETYTSSANTTTNATTLSSSAVNDGSWHTIKISASSSSTNIYLDGVLLATKSGSYTPFNLVYNQIGCTQSKLRALQPNANSSDNGWFYFNGLVDDFYFYNAAL